MQRGEDEAGREAVEAFQVTLVHPAREHDRLAETELCGPAQQLLPERRGVCRHDERGAGRALADARQRFDQGRDVLVRRERGDGQDHGTLAEPEASAQFGLRSRLRGRLVAGPERDRVDPAFRHLERPGDVAPAASESAISRSARRADRDHERAPQQPRRRRNRPGVAQPGHVGDRDDVCGPRPQRSGQGDAVEHVAATV